MTDKDEFILNELKRLQREIDALKEVYAHYLEEGLKREQRDQDIMNKMRATMEEATEAYSEQLDQDVMHSNERAETLEQLEGKIEELEERIEEIEERIEDEL